MEAYFQYRSFTPSSKPAHQAPIIEGKEEEALETSVSPLIFVTFDENDPRDPQNWSKAYKTFVIGLLAFLTLSLTFASSVSSAAERGMMEEFGCSQVAATAATSMFLIGMGVGAMPMAPLSECKCVYYQATWQNVIHDRMAQKSLNPTRLLDLLDLRIGVREGCSHGLMISQAGSNRSILLFPFYHGHNKVKTDARHSIWTSSGLSPHYPSSDSF